MPNVVILAGPNGAGKTSAAPLLLRDTYRVAEFVNADVIARGLSAFAAGEADVEALPQSIVGGLAGMSFESCTSGSNPPKSRSPESDDVWRRVATRFRRM